MMLCSKSWCFVFNVDTPTHLARMIRVYATDGSDGVAEISEMEAHAVDSVEVLLQMGKGTKNLGKRKRI